MSRNAASSAVRKPSPAGDPAAPPQAAGEPRAARLAPDDAPPIASHVHELQHLIAREYEAPAEGRWSARATVAFVLVVCGGFWAGAVFAARLLLH